MVANIKLKIHNGCKYAHETLMSTRAQIGQRLRFRVREDCLGPGNEVDSDPYRARLNAKRARLKLKRAQSTGIATTSSFYGNERVRSQ